MPCFVNQVQAKMTTGLEKLPESTVSHEGIACSGCSQTPITGIRYRCIQCFKFNLCQNCEQKIEHEHNLLKMKTVQKQ
jgi:hypothetical protein